MTHSDQSNSHIGTYSTVVEQRRLEYVSCEIQDGEAFFAFWTDGVRHRVLVHADEYLALLKSLRESAPQRHFTQVRFDVQRRS